MSSATIYAKPHVRCVGAAIRGRQDRLATRQRPLHWPGRGIILHLGAGCMLGCALAAICMTTEATDLASLPEHPHWELPIPAQGPAPPAPPGAEAVADLSAQACGLCHPPQFDAWRESLHAAALSPGLLGQLGAFDGETLEDCLTCHSPRQEMLDQWWDQGLEGAAAMAGVDCATCHVRGHLRHGPRDIPETPHGPVRALALYREAAFCAPCHQFDDSGLSVNGKPLENTYVEWRQSRYAQDGVTCQDCHMPERRHEFKGIHDRETTRQGLTVHARRTGDGLRVRAGNTGAGHALPTYVTPRILIRMGAADGEQALEHVIARRMRWSLDEGWVEIADDRLFPDQWVTLDLPLPKDRGGQVSVRVEPDQDYHARVYPALLRMLEERLTDAEKALLRKAWEQSGTTAYSLYRFTCPPWNGHEEPCDEQP